MVFEFEDRNESNAESDLWTTVRKVAAEQRKDPFSIPRRSLLSFLRQTVSTAGHASVLKGSMIESEDLGFNLKQTRGIFETAEMHERSLPIQRHRLDHIAVREIQRYMFGSRNRS
jgi:hypothetical protein